MPEKPIRRLPMNDPNHPVAVASRQNQFQQVFPLPIAAAIVTKNLIEAVA
jgi:hypothetical protein